ncbi:hypothetical protein BDK51DRAFT_7058, partial [Blyttiomyces helicus]
DEVARYRQARYLSATEAAYKIIGGSMHLSRPSVICLPVHLEGEHCRPFDPEDDPQRIQHSAETRTTMLIDYFRANASPDTPIRTKARSLIH